MRRLIAVEKTLKIPLEDRSQCAAELREANIVEIIAVRHHDVLMLDTLGRPIIGKENSPEVGIRAYATISKGASNTKQPEPVWLLFCLYVFLCLSGITCTNVGSSREEENGAEIEMARKKWPNCRC